MRNINQYWWLITLRGAVALVASFIIAFLPGMMNAVFLMPLAVIFMILGLTCYGIADSAVLLVAGFKCEPRSPWRRTLWIQAALGISIGLLMLTLALEKVDLHWFIALAAVQAFTAGFGELALARKACEYRADRWFCYAGFVTAIAAGSMLLFLRNSDLRTLMFWLVCYVLFFGVSQMALSIRLWLTRHQHLEEACS
jgi:hypothetical protein